MKTWKKLTLTIISILLLLGIYFFYVATKKPMTAADSKPFKSINATELSHELDSSFHNMDSVYNNKNIAITGKIKDIDTTTKHIFIEVGDNSSINCSFSKDEFQKYYNEFKLGSSCQIKGIYSGATGYESNADNDLDMIANEKIIYLKTCTINK